MGKGKIVHVLVMEFDCNLSAEVFDDMDSLCDYAVAETKRNTLMKTDEVNDLERSLRNGEPFVWGTRVYVVRKCEIRRKEV